LESLLNNGGFLDEKQDGKGITTSKEKNFSEWYVEVLRKSEFVESSDVSGALIFRPSAYAAWELLSSAVDKEFKKSGIENVYFPLFIPEKYLKKEAEHFEGFSPEVAWVTEAGKSKLDERLAVRPTSETIIYPSYAKWIRSWRDLPLRYNMWNNVVRWEFRHPTPFLRTREFLWNEGHTIYATEEEALAERDVILGIYENALRKYLALPGIVGKKSDKEKFAGAVASYSIEHLMPDGWAIQGPDFHFDGQNFSKAFGIEFLDKDGKRKFAWQNTYAITTRELGVMVAVHGDDKGLVIPPMVASPQVVVVPIFKDENMSQVLEFSKKIAKSLDGIRVKVDDREGYTPGYKFNEWELKGVPLRLEIGQKEMNGNYVMAARRDTGKKVEVPVASLKEKISEILEDIQSELYKKAEAKLKSGIHAVDSYEELKEIIKKNKGIAHAPWCGSQKCEDSIKEETGAKITNMPLDQGDLHGNCIYCGKKAKYMANFARSY